MTNKPRTRLVYSTDPDPLPSEVKGLEMRPEADNLVGIYAALSGTARDAVLAEYGGAQFSVFKPALVELAVEGRGRLGRRAHQRGVYPRRGGQSRASAGAGRHPGVRPFRRRRRCAGIVRRTRLAMMRPCTYQRATRR